MFDYIIVVSGLYGATFARQAKQHGKSVLVIERRSHIGGNIYTKNIEMWGVITPEEAQAKIAEQRAEIVGDPKNLEEQAISLVGRDIYEKLIKGYTEKQ